MSTGLFFGSFNPIHLGHIAIAGYMLEFVGMDELWFVVSPQNPLKLQSDLAEDKHRLEMVKLAIQEYTPRFQVCDIEMQMPRPSYTIDTLKQLEKKHGDRRFMIIVGSDSIDTITQWKDFESLLSNYKIFVYPRMGSDIEKIKVMYPVEIISAPIIEMSSSFIRDLIRKGKSVQYFMPNQAYRYMINHNVYTGLKR